MIICWFVGFLFLLLGERNSILLITASRCQILFSVHGNQYLSYEGDEQSLLWLLGFSCLVSEAGKNMRNQSMIFVIHKKKDSNSPGCCWMMMRTANYQSLVDDPG